MGTGRDGQTRPSRRYVGASPIGLGYTNPNHYLEMAKVLSENRDQLAYAWRILNDGCCDGCALGTVGMRDWTIGGIHLCTVRLKMLRLNTMPAADVRGLERPERLRAASAKVLRRMGRLPLAMGDPVLLRSEVGEFRGKARITDIAPGNLAVHWPEGNALIRTGHRPELW